MRLLEREQDDFESGRRPQDSSRALSDILCDKGDLWRQMDATQIEINEVLDEMQRDDEAFKEITRNEGLS